jgi:hypothetical protein
MPSGRHHPSDKVIRDAIHVPTWMLLLALLVMGMWLVLRAGLRHPVVAAWLVGVFLIARQTGLLQAVFAMRNAMAR